MDRDLITKRLETDLMGPLAEDEVLNDAKPSDVYLTGILWPRESRIGAEEDDRLDSAGTSAGGEDDTEGAGEEVPLAGLMRPCAAGLSFAVSDGDDVRLDVSIRFALYEREELEDPDEATRIESQPYDREQRKSTSANGTASTSPHGGCAAWLSFSSSLVVNGRRRRSSSARSLAGSTPASRSLRR